MLLPTSNFCVDELSSNLFDEYEVKVFVARFDRIHKTVSGNKLFKLNYYISECVESESKTLLTFGGAYSNHLAATAFLCKENNLKCIGIVRGEKPASLSHTLQHCLADGMQLEFVSRDEYQTLSVEKDNDLLKNKFGDCTIVPEGGYGKKGASGAGLMIKLIEKENFSHIATCVGTATTIAGLMQTKSEHQQIIAVPIIKNMTDIFERIHFLNDDENYPEVWNDYHFGGYAKFDQSLINFMNNFWKTHKVETDFVYTAKLMYAITDQIKKGFFKKGSRICCMHTGGLQGNLSLQKNVLEF